LRRNANREDRQLVEVARYAPSTTGRAHPGTLLAGLLCWLDARSRGARLLLRLEDLDPQRCRPEYADAMRDDLAWIGLDFDEVSLQSESAGAHEAAIAALAESGRLYPCRCSRSHLRAHGEPTPDGGFRYPNTCRGRPLADAGPDDALRVRLDPGLVEVRDETREDLSQDVSAAFGDPIVRRRDGGVAYHLASVVDDAGDGVTRIVRGRDLATTTATQVALRRLLGLQPEPVYRHHLLLLERRGDKLAKLHGSVSVLELREVYDGEGLCGLLAHAAGLVAEPQPLRPDDLVEDFDWRRVGARDRVLTWDGALLHLD
jgi:glutamyl-tRNA synthetase/glutamyl-Q tRNA(Asp) synthetase